MPLREALSIALAGLRGALKLEHILHRLHHFKGIAVMALGVFAKLLYRVAVNSLTMRPAGQDDLDLLWDFLAIAACEQDADAARAVPIVAAHLTGWQRPSDFGVVAERGGSPVGAAWARQFTFAEQPAFYVDANTPEVSIGVREGARGQGVGRILLEVLVQEASRRGVGLCLNVRDTNAAPRLYARAGFRYVPGSEVRNRCGGLSLGMMLGGTG